MGGIALGGIVLSTLVVMTDLATALLLLGGFTTIVVLVQWPMLARIDADRQPIDPELLELVRSVSIFAPLPAYSLEQLLSNANPETYSISRSVFLEAITGVPRSLNRAQAEVQRRLD